MASQVWAIGMQSFRSLEIWKKSHALTLVLYKATKQFPREELFGLTSQIRRAAASIPANIAEGCGRSGPAELARYCQIAAGSASELEYHVLLAHDLRLLEDDSFSQISTQVVEIKRMLTAFIKRVTEHRNTGKTSTTRRPLSRPRTDN